MDGRGSEENQVREQIRQELSLWTPQWEHCLKTFISRDPMSEEDTSALLTLTQRTRNFFRILGDPCADNTAVALESLLTLAPMCSLQGNPHIHKAIQIGIRSMWDAFLRYPKDGCVSCLPTPPEVPPLSFAEHRLLLALNTLPHPNICGSPCETFKVIQSENDTKPLLMRSIDLYRMEDQGFSLYLIEIAWEEVLDRNGSLSRMLENLGRNGYIFDVRPTDSFLEPEQEEHSGHILRVLHASPLDIDFLEALTRLPVRHLHSVNATRIRRNLPSWGKTLQSSVPAFISNAHECGKDIKELISDYDLAFASLIKRSRQEIPAFAASQVFSPETMNVSVPPASEASSVLTKAMPPSSGQSQDQSSSPDAGKKMTGQTRSEALLQSLFF